MASLIGRSFRTEENRKEAEKVQQNRIKALRIEQHAKTLEELSKALKKEKKINEIRNFNAEYWQVRSKGKLNPRIKFAQHPKYLKDPANIKAWEETQQSQANARLIIKSNQENATAREKREKQIHEMAKQRASVAAEMQMLILPRIEKKGNVYTLFNSIYPMGIEIKENETRIQIEGNVMTAPIFQIIADSDSMYDNPAILFIYQDKPCVATTEETISAIDHAKKTGNASTRIHGIPTNIPVYVLQQVHVLSEEEQSKIENQIQEQAEREGPRRAGELEANSFVDRMKAAFKRRNATVQAKRGGKRTLRNRKTRYTRKNKTRSNRR